MRLTVIIPALNVEPGLEESVKQLKAAVNVQEILIIDDVTRPHLLRKAKILAKKLKRQHGAQTIFRTKERGFGSALRRGFKEATGDVVVVSMGDLSDDPKTIRKMVAKIREGYDVVAGSRYAREGRSTSSKQKISTFVSRLIGTFSDVRCTDCTNAFKAYRKDVVKQVATTATFFDLSLELAVKAGVRGYRIGEVFTRWKNREVGTSNFRTVGESIRYFKWTLYAILHKPSFLSRVIAGLSIVFLVIRLSVS